MAFFPHFPNPPPPFHPIRSPPPPPHTIPPPPPHPVPPPPHIVPPPPPPHVVPPPPPPPHVVPPPPPHVVPPLPPHVFPPPPPFHPITPPPPTPPSPDHGPTVIIVVFISLGGVFFLAFCMFALWCLIKKRKKKTVHETDIVRTQEHLKVKEAIVQGPHGPQVVVLSVEDDKHIEEEIIKNEKVEETNRHVHGMRSTGNDVEAGESSFPLTHQSHHHLEH